jgi:hypothetical protein
VYHILILKAFAFYLQEPTISSLSNYGIFIVKEELEA